MFYNILDTKRQEILPLFEHFKKQFYLAGGTALALQIGHRDSIDFDFFSESTFDTASLFSEIERVFIGHTIMKTQDENNTLSVVIDKSIRLSFMSYAYPLVQPLVDEPYIRLASITDIWCMKLSAIVGRATLKDYVDLYYILKLISLEELIRATSIKFPSLDAELILKSIVYFDDIVDEPIIFLEGYAITLDEIKNTLRAAVKGVLQ